MVWLALILAATAAREPVEAIPPVVRTTYGDPVLPAGGRVELFDGTGLRLTMPAGNRPEPEEALTPVDGVALFTKTVKGDFLAGVRVRLVVPPEGRAAGRSIPERVDATGLAAAVPKAAAGLYVTGPGLTPVRAQAFAWHRRTGALRREGIGNAWQGPTGDGGAHVALRPPEQSDQHWVHVRRTGDSIEVGGGPFGERPRWVLNTYTPSLPESVLVRLFATGNLDKPFTVEFDRFSITPLPAGEKK